MFIIILISITAGGSIVLARNINSELAIRIGLLQGTFLNNLIGLLFSLLFMLFSGEVLRLSTNLSRHIPIWAYLGGLLGVIVVSVSNFLTPKISAFYLTLLIFIGQLFTGLIIDYFAVGNISTGKIIGGILVLSGLTYNSIIDKRAFKTI